MDERRREHELYRALAAAAALAVAAGFPGCGLDKTGTVVTPCQGPEDCEDTNECTVNSCGAEGQCSFPAVPGEQAEQVQGDCRTAVCDGSTPTYQPDPEDADDGNPCTLDSCPGGVAEHDAAGMEGKACLLGALSGVCKAGECKVACASASDDCDDGNACTDDACDVAAQECTYETEALHGTVVDDASTSDCAETRCVHGVATEVPDNAEVPDDGQECTVDTCVAKAPVHQPKPEGTPCGTQQDQKCNAGGACVGCIQAADCVGVDDECKARTCLNQVCGVDYTASGTPIGRQTGGDCKASVCDGNGGVIVIEDTTDLPGDDGLDCTASSCNGDMPEHVPVAEGQPCDDGAGTICASGGVCVGCLTSDQCAADQLCGNGMVQNKCCNTCASLGRTCGKVMDGCMLQLDCNNGQLDPASETDVDCGNKSAACPVKCPQGKACESMANCAMNKPCSEGVCCNLTCGGTCRSCLNALTGQPTGTCSNVLAGLEDPDVIMGMPCVDGTYLMACDGAAACKREGGQPCGANAECLTAICSDADAVCCDAECTAGCQSCLASVNGSADGSCLPTSAATDPEDDCSGGQCCDGAGVCGGNGC